jgi:hypothetical protein
VDQQQEEIGHPRHRTRDVAECYDLRPVAVPAFPGGEERYAAPGGVAADGAANVEMAAALPLAWLGVALAQPAGDLADQMPHLLDLPRLDPRQRRIAQNLVAQVFRLLAPVQHQRLRDGIPDRTAQPVQRVGQLLHQRRVGCRQIVEVVAQALDAHLVEDAAGEDAALREIADIGQRCRARRIGNGRRNLVAVLRQQHLRELAEPLGLLVAAARVIRRIG